MPEERPQPAGPRSPLGVLGLVTLVGSAFVGFNSLVTSCASEHVARDAAQLHATEERERFWTEAMQELSDVVKDKDKADANYGARCKLLAHRTAPFANPSGPASTGIDDDADPSPDIRELSDRVGKLQAEFATQIRDPSIVGEGCAGEFDLRKQTDIARIDKLDRVADTVTTEAARSDVAALIPKEAITSRTDLITLTPLSRLGIDVDVFWCETASDDATNANFKNALLLGQRLADYALNGRKLTESGQSDLIGRVRVRMLAEALRRRGTIYPDPAGRNVLHGFKRVQPFMRAVAKEAQLSGIPGVANLAVAAPVKGEPIWYVSAFVCGASARAAPATGPIPSPIAPS